MRALLVVAFVACGGTTATSTTPGADGGDAGATLDGATDDAASDGGAGLFPAGATKIVVTEKGGFTASGPDGSTCTQADATYTLLYATRDLSWKICESNDGAPNAFVTGQKTIAADDFGPLDDALHALTRTTDKKCGADKPREEIVFTTPSGDVTYEDDFYFCDPTDGKVYVSGIDEILAELGKLTR